MILMGIDPGSRKCGYGVLQVEKYKIIAAGSGIISIKTTIPSDDKLLYLADELKKIIDEYKPDYAAVENIFYSKNIQTAFTLGHFRGVIIYCLKSSGIPVFSFSPKEIKQSVTGRGDATKEQVAFTIQSLLKLKNPAKEDAADGLACAMCLFNKKKYER